MAVKVKIKLIFKGVWEHSPFFFLYLQPTNLKTYKNMLITQTHKEVLEYFEGKTYKYTLDTLRDIRQVVKAQRNKNDIASIDFPISVVYKEIENQ